MTLPTVVQIKEYRSGEFFQRESRAAATYRQTLEIQGNSILSSVFVEAIDAGASIKINYYDTTTGASVGERFDLNGHDLIDTSSGPFPKTFRILVPRIHHKVVCEAIVSGGSATFSVYGTAVPTTTSDIDQALIRDGDTFEQPIDKAMVVGVLDPNDNKLYFLRGDQGSLIMGSSLASPVIQNITLGASNTEVSHTFPANTKQFLIRARTQAKIKLAFVSGMSGIEYLTISQGGYYLSPQTSSNPRTIYIQSPVAGLEVELESWS